MNLKSVRFANIWTMKYFFCILSSLASLYNIFKREGWCNVCSDIEYIFFFVIVNVAVYLTSYIWQGILESPWNFFLLHFHRLSLNCGERERVCSERLENMLFVNGREKSLQQCETFALRTRSCYRVKNTEIPVKIQEKFLIHVNLKLTT